MSEHPGKERVRHPADLYRGVYSQPYHEIVQPGRVWTASKYFLRRWSAYLTPAEMWLVIGARQLSYLNRRRPWFTAYDNTLAAAAGLNVDVYRRTVKRAIAEQEGAIAHFLSKKSDPSYVVRDDVPRKGRTRYTVRLDDPLTPADAAALAHWLDDRLQPDATTEEIVALLREARALEPQRLWADAPAEHEAHEGGALLDVADVVRHVAPQLRDDLSEQGDWQAAAGALHTHLIAAELVHLEPHYFREKWLPELGAGPALLIITLRSLCYFNEESGEIRDVVHVEANEVAQQLQTTTRTLRRWFKKLEKAAAHDRLFGPFFAFLENNKQPNQSVLSSYRINLKMPLTPEDLARYEAMPAANGNQPPLNGSPMGLADKKSATRQKVTDKKSVTNKGVADKKSVTGNGQRDKKSVTKKGAGQNVGYGAGGGGQKVGASQTKGRPFKYYERLLTILNLKEIKQLEQNTEQQYQYLWHVRDGRAHEGLAAVVADGSLVNLLELLGIHEPARGRLVAQNVRAADVIAWYLFAQQQPNLDQPVGYVVARALAGDMPPAPFVEMAHLSWEQWRAYAGLVNLAPSNIHQAEMMAAWPCLEQWLALYGDVPPEQLPFGVGEGLLTMRDALREEERKGQVEEDPQPENAPLPERAAGAVQDADAAQWQEALAELALQMTQSTFDAWLRGSRFVRRDGPRWTISVMSPAAQSWLQTRLNHVVQRTLGAVVGHDVVVTFVEGQDERV